MDDRTTPEHLDPRDVLLERFTEREIQRQEQEAQSKLKDEFNNLSNLKKSMVRRKVQKLIRRRKHDTKRNAKH